MASLLDDIRFTVSDAESLEKLGANKYKANYCICGTKKSYSTPKRIDVMLTPNKSLQPLYYTSEMLFPYDYHHTVYYNEPNGVSQQSVMYMKGGFVESEEDEVGVLWLSRMEITMLKSLPKEEISKTFLILIRKDMN